MCIYYTDEHNVDEDATTIANYGGRWDKTSSVGITLRELFDTSSGAANTVASLKNKNSLSRY